MDLLNNLLGLGVEAKELSVLQVSLRSMVVFIVALFMVRVADKRFLAKLNALDAILGLVLASMLARGINGSCALVPTIVGGFVLVFLHRLFCSLARHSRSFSNFVKGHADLVIKDGKVIKQALRSNNLTESDLIEELRQQGGVRSPEEVKEAYIERDGKISVIVSHK